VVACVEASSENSRRATNAKWDVWRSLRVVHGDVAQKVEWLRAGLRCLCNKLNFQLLKLR
jgi:hypothetical protein